MLCEVPLATDNFACFQQLRAAYPRREGLLSEAVMRAVTTTRSAHTTVLDVGSADARLAEAFAEKLTSTLAPNLTTLLEPDPRAAADLVSTIENDRSALWGCSTYLAATLQRFLQANDRRSKFDVILASHVFYHFEQWEEMTIKLLEMLTSTGVLVVILDSGTSPLYRMRRELVAAAREVREHSGYGHLRFAEDFGRLLAKAGLRYYQEELKGALVFNQRELPHHLWQVLSFIYRFPVIDSQQLRKTASNWLSPYRSGRGLVVPWTEQIFAVAAE